MRSASLRALEVGVSGSIDRPSAEAALPARSGRSTAADGEDAEAPTGMRGRLRTRPYLITSRVLAAVVAVLIFIFALRTLVYSAKVFGSLIDGLGASAIPNFLGLGWLSAYAVLSGSPIAATSLTLLDSGVLSPVQAFAQIAGSRMGASFIVLAVGLIYYVRGRRLADSVHVGVVALLVTITTMAPTAIVGAIVLGHGWLGDLSIGATVPLVDGVRDLYDSAIRDIGSVLPRGVLFPAGVAVMLLAFRIFDGVLPTQEDTTDRVARFDHLLRSRWFMFGLGAGVTLVTLSVSLSVTLLVPLAMRGSIRRDAVAPYVMGANVTTFIDTLFAAVLLDHPQAETVVLVEMVGALAMAVLLLGVAYRPYTRAINATTRYVTHDVPRLGLFLGAIFLVPLALLLI